MKTSQRRNIIDWNKKNNTDESRIADHLRERGEITEDKPLPKNDTTDILPSQPTEEDEYHPFFNISLISDEENIIDSEKRSERETMQIAKQQYQMGQRSILMDTAILKDQSHQKTPPENPVPQISKSNPKQIESVPNSEEELAKLILEKSGRKISQKNAVQKPSSDEDDE